MSHTPAEVLDALAAEFAVQAPADPAPTLRDSPDRAPARPILESVDTFTGPIRAASQLPSAGAAIASLQQAPPWERIGPHEILDVLAVEFPRRDAQVSVSVLSPEEERRESVVSTFTPFAQALRVHADHAVQDIPDTPPASKRRRLK